MSRTNQLLDLLNETFLFKMSFNRKYVLNKVRDKSLIIYRHFIKLVGSTKESERKHWTKEINTWLFDLQESKSSQLSEKDWFRLLWEEPTGDGVESISRCWRSILNEYDCNIYRNSLSDKELWDSLKSLYSYLCTDLSKNEFVGLQKYLEV